ncbi:MAG: copper-containing nitrite reductase [Elainella sp. Prado103]|jgi:nitrite reductase (NO-forming)|nr:copper-containing nitrite reductase [Elainella sp. Prado103]
MIRLVQCLVTIVLLCAFLVFPFRTPLAFSANIHSVQPDVRFKLRTDIGEGKLIFAGVGGKINHQVNPDLKVKVGEVVQITLIDGDGAEHDITVPEFNTQSDKVVGQGSSSVIVFRADKEGVFDYFCSIPGHVQAGMIGKLVVEGQTTAKVDEDTIKTVDIAQLPTNVPKPIGQRPTKLLRLDLETVEERGRLADNTTYNYWTFNHKVPGPMLRVRVGDTVEVHLKNHKTSRMIHSVDFHAVTGPGGGAVMTQASPGEEKVFTFKAMNPGLFVYHCATPMVAHHISNGMYGMILVEPEGGLPPVDREFYVMQGEIYTVEPHGNRGNLEFSVEKLLSEAPEYFVFNGAEATLKKDHPLQAKVGETIRIYFGVGGPNYTSSFHVIGEIMDRVYEQASLTSPPLTDVQTTTVPPGGATMVEMTLDVPGNFLLVDHALSRLEKGLIGTLVVEGAEHAEIYHQGIHNAAIATKATPKIPAPNLSSLQPRT